MRGGIAERGGVRVGHRIIEINNQSVVATSHEKIVNILANSVGEVSLSLLTYFLRFFIGNLPFLFIKVTHENDANSNVSVTDRPRAAQLYLASISDDVYLVLI